MSLYLQKINSQTCLRFPFSHTALKDICKKIKSLTTEIPGNISFDKFTFISVSRLEPSKGLENLFNAAALLKNTDFNILLVGKGGYENYLRDLARKLNIDKKVLFIGFTRNP